LCRHARRQHTTATGHPPQAPACSWRQRTVPLPCSLFPVPCSLFLGVAKELVGFQPSSSALLFQPSSSNPPLPPSSSNPPLPTLLFYLAPGAAPPPPHRRRHRLCSKYLCDAHLLLRGLPFAQQCRAAVAALTHARAEKAGVARQQRLDRVGHLLREPLESR
jgi:hypothetical protein